MNKISISIVVTIISSVAFVNYFSESENITNFTDDTIVSNQHLISQKVDLLDTVTPEVKTVATLKINNSGENSDLNFQEPKIVSRIKSNQTKTKTESNFQEELPLDILEMIDEDMKNNKFDFGDIGGFGKDGIKKLHNSDLKDTISINSLPPAIAKEAIKNIGFRKENGYDNVSERDADEILSAIGLLSGTEFPIPNLDFELAKIPSPITDYYQYLGYIYPYMSENGVTYSSVKLVFSHMVNNSIVVLSETSLKNGGATLTTEFVNTNVQNCPAMLIEKRDANDRRYGQINWNTNLIGFVVYQFNVSEPTSELLLLANNIAVENLDILNCDTQENIEGEILPNIGPNA